jgi:hypothetical protein
MGDSTLSVRTLAIARLAMGGLQGLALYWLWLAFSEKTWPATNGFVYAPSALIALFVPLLVSQALGTLRLRTLAIWAAAATLIVGGLGVYDIWHSWPVDWTFGDPPAPRPHVFPAPQLYAALVIGLFVAQALITGGDTDRKFVANYTTHFDVAWKIAVQGGLAVAFVGTFWGVLWLGAGLFDLINLEFFERLIRRRWFSIPATTIAFSAALHVTDVRAGVVRGIRTLGLTLLSWLLPLMALITALFLAALIFTGVQALWDTQVATALLLTTFGALVILLNAAFQDGHADRAAPSVLRYPGSVAALTLVPLAALAGCAVFLRVQQYGWTAPRIYASACVLVAAFYAAGYAYAALRSGPWLKRIERWNFQGSLLVLAVLFALFTPIADPYRISVASQVQRLERGAVTPETFDYAHLRWSGGRYGQAALASLSAKTDGEGAEYIREAASRELAATNRYGEVTETHVDVHPAGATLPATFVAQRWTSFGFSYPYVPPPTCIAVARPARCDGWVMDLDGDGAGEVVLKDRDTVYLFRLTDQGMWRHVGSWRLPNDCAPITSEMAAGRFATARPEPGRWPDLEISGMRFRLLENDTTPACPN